MDGGAADTSINLWALFGAAGAIVFYGRFYVQWIASEFKKQSVIPTAFWYMSSVGSVMVFIYAVYLADPGQAFGQCFNIIVYSRNLTHIWRERGQLTKTLRATVNVLAALIVVTAVIITLMIWLHMYQANQTAEPLKAAANWFWIGVWGVGQVMFFLRFFIQWLVTEVKKKSIVPPVFWYLSLVASILQAAYFGQLRHWIFMVGMLATILIYARNIWFIHRRPEDAQVVTKP